MDQQTFTFKGPLLEECDLPRLNTAGRKVWDIMIDGKWHNLNDVATATGQPHSSVTAFLRGLRCPENGGHTVDIAREKEGKGTWLYRLMPAGREEVRQAKAYAQAKKKGNKAADAALLAMPAPSGVELPFITLPPGAFGVPDPTTIQAFNEAMGCAADFVQQYVPMLQKKGADYPVVLMMASIAAHLRSFKKKA